MRIGWLTPRQENIVLIAILTVAGIGISALITIGVVSTGMWLYSLLELII